MTALTGWDNFYVIVASSAGALIGLQFVVITLIAEMPSARDLERAPAARLERRPSFILESCCCYLRLSTRRGTQ
jgi:hypothetical protein